MWEVLSSKYGPGAPKIFSGRFTKLPEVSLFYSRLLLSLRFTLDLRPPHATPLPLSLSLFLSFCPHLSFLVQWSTHFEVPSQSHSETVLVNPASTGAWKLLPWSKLGSVSPHLICLPYLCATWCPRSKICFMYLVQFSSYKVNSTFNCEKEVTVIFFLVFLQMCHFMMVGYVIITLSFNHTLYETCYR